MGEIETLEDRVMLASVTSLDFQIMPGMWGSSANGQFVAHVNSNDFYNVEIDVDANPNSNGNRQAEYFAANNGSTTATAQGSMPYGTHTIYARALDYMSLMNGGTSGGWQPFQITVGQPTPVSVSFAASSQNTNSEGEHRSVAIQLSGPATSPVGVGISVVGGTASHGADFTLNNQSVYFAPGETSKTIDLQFLEDQILEPTETYTLRLQNPSGAVLGSNPDFQGEILDVTSSTSAPRVEVSSASGIEGTNLDFRVELIGDIPSGTQIPIGYSFIPGTATAGDNGDYRDNHLSLMLSTSNRVGNVSAYALTDALNENPEHFYLSVSNTAGIEVKYLGNLDMAIGTIINKAAPMLTIDAVSVDEGSTAPQNVHLSAGVDVAASFAYNSSDGTATVGAGDYMSFSGTIYFAAHQTLATIQVNALTDSISPETEYYHTLINIVEPNQNLTLVSAAVNIKDAETEPKLELDVNNNGVTSDAVDDAAKYLPGYEGDVAMLARESAQRVQVIASNLTPGSRITFRLKGTSKLKGMASNALFKIGFSDKFDFAFDVNAESQERAGVTVGGDGREVASLYVFDFGGVTTVQLLQNDKVIREMQVPVDSNGDRIADVWAEKYVTAKGAFSDSDLPGDNFGDMIPAFDEYRGFIIQGAHVRTNPDKKSLFIWDQLGDIGVNDPFELLKTSQVEWYVVSADELLVGNSNTDNEFYAINYLGIGINRRTNGEGEQLKTLARVVPVVGKDDIRPLLAKGIQPRKALGLTTGSATSNDPRLRVNVDVNLIRRQYEAIQTITTDLGSHLIYKNYSPYDDGGFVVNGQLKIGETFISYKEVHDSNGFSLDTKSVSLPADSRTIILNAFEKFSPKTPLEWVVTKFKEDRYYFVEGTEELIRFDAINSIAVEPYSYEAIGAADGVIELDKDLDDELARREFPDKVGVYYASVKIGETVEWVSFESLENEGESYKFLGVKRGLFGTHAFEALAGASVDVPGQLINVERGALGTAKNAVPRNTRLQVVGILDEVSEPVDGGNVFSGYSNVDLAIKKVIAHELGHAMALEHVEKTIMERFFYSGKYEDGVGLEYFKRDNKMHIEFEVLEHQNIRFQARLSIEVQEKVINESLSANG